MCFMHCWCLYSHFPTLCTFGSVVCVLLLFYFCVLFSLSVSSKCFFHLPLICSLSSIMFPFMSLHWTVWGLYPSFIFCTILCVSLRFLSFCSSSIAINWWLITCLFFFLHAVYVHFLVSSYSALFTLIRLARYAWHALLFCSSSILHCKSFFIIFLPSSYPSISIAVFLTYFDLLPLLF